MPDMWAPCSFRAHRRLHPVHNTRVVGIFDGQLYASAASGTFVNVFTVGSGLPTGSGQVATSLPGMPTATGPSPQCISSSSTPMRPFRASTPSTSPMTARRRPAAFRSGPSTAARPATTFNAGLSTGTRGLTGFVTGSDVTLVATAASATMFHGVALAPQ